MSDKRGIIRIAVLLAAILSIVGPAVTACAPATRIAVKAIARGAPAAAPFFADALGLAADHPISDALALGGGVQKGNRPGLYGGTRHDKSCDKGKLVEFLKDRANRKKALEWAGTQGIGIDEIGDFVGKLTPVLLRNDTLVKNHDYKKGKAVAFEALLEAGIAVLVDLHGRPVVQCSCGNPLGAFEHDVDRADVEFKGTNKKWASYDRGKVVKVEPADDGDEVGTFRLVDVQEADAGLERPVGSDGTRDTALPEDPGGETSGEGDGGDVEVPDVTQSSVEEAAAILRDQGLVVETTEEPSETAGPGTVLGQSPAAGETVPASSTVTLTVATAPATTDPQVTDPEVTDPQVTDPEVIPSPGELATPTPTDVATPGDTPPAPEPPPSEGLFGSSS
ncbi:MULTISPECIES: DUF6777 domain-containing protein [unclassified Streptomyces]|uniref:DUF6777 domain-containing protein n=1 Tax=unclassified Streptomyces TaxID=2593676 RepID=UPI0023663DF8|nr:MULTISPECIES: DUF6777 domain-containing protein [unclassified Streptomyces]MDF3148842.1 PASTA domain-containing protein [Streptomyces sp. T21Q-yed]WDF38963.1 PASTA domain-containing protein [Streptomyces sp. T12]